MIDIPKEKSSAISIVRILAMLSILLCHFLQGFDNYLANKVQFGVQIFITLSGFLYGHKSVSNWLKWYIARFIKLFVPLYVFVLFALPAIQFLTDTPVGIWNYIKAGGVNGIEHLWFMKAIALCYLITPVLQILKRYAVYLFFVLLTISIVYFLLFKMPLNAFSWILSYSCGYFAASLESWHGKLMRMILYLLGMILVGYGIWNVLNNSDTSYNIPWRCFLIGLVSCICGVDLLSHLHIENLPPVLKSLDKNSFYIYLTHHIFLIGPLSLVPYFSNAAVCIFVCMFVIIIATVLLRYISEIPIKKLNSLMR